MIIRYWKVLLSMVYGGKVDTVSDVSIPLYFVPTSHPPGSQVSPIL